MATALTLTIIGLLPAGALANTALVGSVPYGSSQKVRQLAVNPNTDRIWSAGYFADPGLTVFDATTAASPAVVTTIPTVGGGVTVNPATNRFYTSDGYGGHMLTYNGATNTQTHSTAATGCGGMFDFDATANLVYDITQCNDSVNVMNAATDALVTTKTTCCAVGNFVRVNAATGRSYANNYFNTRVFGPSPAFTLLTTLSGQVLATNATLNRLYLWPGSGTTLNVLDGTTHALLATIPNGVGAGGTYEPGVTDETLGRTYIMDTAGGRVIVIDDATNTVAGSLSLPPGVESRAVAVDPVKHRVYVAGGAYAGPKTLYVFSSTAATVTESPIHATGSTGRSFTVASGAGNTRYWCSLDTAPGTPIDYPTLAGLYPDCGAGGTAIGTPLTLSGLSEGPHTLYVATGASSLTDPFFTLPEFTSTTFFVDSVAPDTTITAHPPGATLSTSADLAFTGSDPAPSSGGPTFECSLDGAAYTACSSIKHYAGLGEGGHTFDVRARDTEGNVDPTPAHVAWGIDATNPTATITGPAARTQDAYGVGAHEQLVRPFYALDSGSPSYSCSDPLAGTPPFASGIASCTDDFDNETLGNHVFHVTATDNVGHTFTSPGRGYRIVPPRYDAFLKTDGPTAYFRLDDALGASTMTDASGHGHDGTYQNGVVLHRQTAVKCEDWSSVHPYRQVDSWCDPFNFENQGYSAFFDGKADHGYANNIDASGDADHGQVNHNSFSAEAWGYPLDTGLMGLMEHGEEFRVNYDGHWRARLVNGTELVDPAFSPPDRWYHVAVTWDGDTVSLYVNGVRVAHQSGVTHSWAGGQPTFLVGRTNVPDPWWHGYIDEVAYFNGQALGADQFADRYEIARTDEPGGAGAGTLDMTRPTVSISQPQSDATYNGNAKTLPNPPHAGYSCYDPDGYSDIVNCSATVDGTPINWGDPLPLTAGTHDFRVDALDASGLRFEYHHRYTVMPFDQIVLGDHPDVYYRFDEASDAHVAVDASGNGHHGEYKNDTQNGPAGISGDGNTTRDFLGRGGYLYVNGVPSGDLGWTTEAWINPADHGDMAIMDHGAGGSGPALFLRNQHLVLHLPDPQGDLVDPSAFPYDGAFHQVAARWDGVTAVLFVDGARVAQREASEKAPSGTPTLYFGFGNVGLAQPWFRGTIDEASYYRTALIDQRIKEHYLADPPADRGGGGTGAGSSAPAGTAPLTPPPTPGGGPGATVATGATSARIVRVSRGPSLSRGAAVTVRCAGVCRVAAALTVSRAKASRYHVGRSTTIGTASGARRSAGDLTLKIPLTATARRRLNHVHALGATLRITVTDAGGGEATMQKALTLRR